MVRLFRPTVLLLVLLSGPAVHATHLVGGNIGYRYLGETAPGSQVYRYEVRMEFYMNAGSNSNFQSLHELFGTSGVPVAVGVYPQDPLAPDADKTLLTTVDMTLTDSLEIVPDLPSGCVIGQGLRVLKGTFRGQVDLPLSLSGYHLYYHMCCRNSDIINLDDPNNTGIGYYAFIPPSPVVNSSPDFLGVPVPFLCVGDTSTFVNTASDPDGDLLIFSFEQPYASTVQLGSVIPPPAVLPWPVPEVVYEPGFSSAQPLGAAGYAFINGATGLTRYVPPVQGNSVVAVEVKEYRNGQLIGRTRRDLQLQAIVCSANNAAVPVSNLPTAYEVQAGDQLCFSMGFTDSDNDSLSLVASGSIFDPAQYAPAATINSPVLGIGAVGSQFCWDTECDQAQDQPYLFSVSVTDNGCPPKTTDVVFQVRVAPFTGAQAIAGPQQVCALQGGAAYTTDDPPNTQFTWTVSGGTIAGGQGTHAITVDWGAEGAGTISVSALSDGECSSAPIDLPVTIGAAPTVAAGADATVCLGDSVQLTATGTGTFSWSPADGLSDPTIADPWAAPDHTTDYIVTANDGGACNATDTLRVTMVGNPVADAGPDLWVCPGFDVQLHGSGGGTPLWLPASMLDDPSSFTPHVSPGATSNFTLTVTDGHGCHGSDGMQVVVNDDPPVDAGPDQAICAGQVVVLGGSPTSVPGATFLWTPGNSLNADTLADPSAAPSANTTYLLTVTSDTCTSHDEVNITLQGSVNADFALRLEPGCAGVRAFLTTTNSEAAHYAWDFGDGTTGDEPAPVHAFQYGQPITITLTVIDEAGCTATGTRTFPVGTFDELVGPVLPNIFTPNGDGRNDLFGPGGDARIGDCGHLLVFNRWGQKVFESLGNAMAWDGRDFAGQACASGTYFYTFTLQEMSLNGTVQLQR